MKVLITGGAGFLGSALANALIAGGHTVRAVDDLSSGDPERLNPAVHFQRGDVADIPRMWTMLQGVDVVCHLAARVSVSESVLYPGDYKATNVGGTMVVHVRNAFPDRLRQAITFHPHALKYNPEYDGVYLGDYTRAGGFIAPGEEFTYTYECIPESAGLWAYHDHGPNHTLNTARGLFGAVLIRERDAKIPDVESVLCFHSWTPPVTGLQRAYQCVNGRAFAGNTPTIRAKVGQDLAIHIVGVDDNFHDFHLHGHRWLDAAGDVTDNPSFGPGQSVLARFTVDNPGRWLYHCHVLAHQDGGMAGWMLVDP